mgnify:FL=1
MTTGAPTDEKRNARARTILKALELEEYAEQHPATLSGGQKQRLALGVALMHDAPIIILDEPTSGLDGANMRNVSQIIRKLAGMGRTILVSPTTQNVRSLVVTGLSAWKTAQSRTTFLSTP